MGVTLTNPVMPPVIQSVAGTTTITQAGAAYSDVDDMSITSTSSGKHIICFQANISAVRNNSNGAYGYIQILQNLTSIAVSQIGVNCSDDEGDALTNQIRINAITIEIGTLSVGDVLKVQWKAAAGTTLSNTVASGDATRNMWIMKVSDV